MPRFFPNRSSLFRGVALSLFLALALATVTASANEPCQRYYRRLGQPPLVLQKTEYTCGAACVVSLVKQLRGKDLKESHVAAVMGTNRSIGTTPEKMVRGLGLFGLNARKETEVGLKALKANFRRGKGQILLVQSGDTAHWVVLADYKDGMITLMDPWRESSGYLVYGEKDFLSLWNTEITGKKINQMALVVE